MKGLFWSLFATLAGVAMLAVGIAGVAGAFEGEDSPSDSSSDSGADVANFDDCPSDDSRFSSFNTYTVRGADNSATVIISCQASRVEVSMIASDLPTAKPRTVALWLYNNRKDAVLIASSQQEPGDESVVVSGELPPGSQNYKKLAITAEKPSADFEDPERPTKIILDIEL
jgi:hypothetical protein